MLASLSGVDNYSNCLSGHIDTLCSIACVPTMHHSKDMKLALLCGKYFYHSRLFLYQFLTSFLKCYDFSRDKSF